MSGYQITTKMTSQNPKTIDKLVNGTGLINIIADTLQIIYLYRQICWKHI